MGWLARSFDNACIRELECDTRARVRRGAGFGAGDVRRCQPGLRRHPDGRTRRCHHLRPAADRRRRCGMDFHWGLAIQDAGQQRHDHSNQCKVPWLHHTTSVTVESNCGDCESSAGSGARRRRARGERRSMKVEIRRDVAAQRVAVERVLRCEQRLRVGDNREPGAEGLVDLGKCADEQRPRGRRRCHGQRGSARGGRLDGAPGDWGRANREDRNENEDRSHRDLSYPVPSP